MSITSLQNFNQNGIELVINTQTGESFASQAGYARMSGVPYSTIRKRVGRIKGRDNSSFKMSEIQTGGGSQEVTLINEDLIVDWIVEDNLVIAKRLLKLGVRAYLHKLAGFEIQTTAIKPKTPQNYLEALKELVAKEEENIALRTQNTELFLQIEENAPKVALANCIAFSDSSINFNVFAKILGTGRTRLFRRLREAGVILKNSNLPCQQWIDLGYFELSEKIHDGKIIPFALITGKGQIWLKQRLDYYQYLEKKAIQGVVTVGSR